VDNDCEHSVNPGEHRPFEELLRRVLRFRDERDWRQYHHPKDLAISICLEAAELLEHFQWKDREEVRRMLADPEARHAAGEEMADILILLLSASDAVGVDLYAAVLAKLEKNAAKYPVEKAKGNARKYDRL
jgi:NTP pyrophosphatase (non-canonical NTP hydrolase)